MTKKFSLAYDAAQYATTITDEWENNSDEILSKDDLLGLASAADESNTNSDDNNYYLVGEDGALGFTADAEASVFWFARPTGGQNIYQEEADVLPNAEWSAEDLASVAEFDELADTHGDETGDRQTVKSPLKILADEFKRKLSGLKSLFTVKGQILKFLLPLVAIISTWILTAVLQKVYADQIKQSPVVVKILAFISFANGAVSNNPIYMLGGLFGKMMFVTAVFSLILGFKNIKNSATNFVGAFKNVKLSTVPFMLYGAGGALVLFNFFCGSAHLLLSMVAVAGAITAFMAISNESGLLGKLIVSLTADVDKQTKARYANKEKSSAVFVGAVVGFVLAIFLSLVRWGFTPYVVGAGLVLIGVLLSLIKKKTPTSITTAFILVLAASLCTLLALNANTAVTQQAYCSSVLLAAKTAIKLTFDPNTPGDYEHVKWVAVVLAQMFGVTVSLVPTPSEELPEEEEIQYTYRLEVVNLNSRKIVMGAKPLTISAAVIATDPNGKSQPDAKLTKNLDFSAQSSIKVNKLGISGKFYRISFEVPTTNKDLPDQASLWVTSSEASLEQKLTFDIIGKPKIEFVEKEYWQKVYSVNLLWGHDATCEIPLRIKNFNASEEIQFDFGGSGYGDGISATCEPVGGMDAERYTLKIKNDTADRPEKSTKSITIHAYNSEQSATASFNVVMYHKGLTIEPKQKDEAGRAVLDTREVDVNSEKRSFKSIRVKVTIVVPDEKGRAIVISPNDCRPVFGEQLVGEGSSAEILEKLKISCEVIPNSPLYYRLTPTATLPHPQGDSPFIGRQKVTAVWNGEEYEDEIEYSVIGLDSDPMADRNKEIENIKKIIRILGISGETRKLIRQDLTKLSVHELCLIRKAIFEAGVESYQRDAAELIAEGNRMDKYVTAFGIAKFCGDQAFSILITYYFGDIVDAVLTPWKELIIDYIANKRSAAEWGIDGQDYGWEDVAKSFAASGENICSTVIGKEVVKEGFVKGDLINLKKLVGRLVAYWLAISTLKHYFTSDNPKVRGSWLAAIWEAAKDLTVGGIKIVVGNYISGWLEKSGLKKKLQDFMTEAWPKFFTHEVASQGQKAAAQALWDKYRVSDVDKFIKAHPEFAAREGGWGAAWLKENASTVAEEQAQFIVDAINKYAGEAANLTISELQEPTEKAVEITYSGIKYVVNLANKKNMSDLVDMLMKYLFSATLTFPQSAPTKPTDPKPNMDAVRP